MALMGEFSACKLTKREQERIYLATCLELNKPSLERSTWVGTILWVLDLPRKIIKNKLIPFGDLDYIEETQLFRRKYNDAKRALLRMKHEKLIETHKTANGIEIMLTGTGKERRLREAIMCSVKRLANEQRCFVIFDIPECVGEIRCALRNFLRKAGFVQLQKSVWVTAKDVAYELALLVKAMKADKWVSVVVGSEFRSEQKNLRS